MTLHQVLEDERITPINLSIKGKSSICKVTGNKNNCKLNRRPWFLKKTAWMALTRDKIHELVCKIKNVLQFDLYLKVKLVMMAKVVMIFMMLRSQSGCCKWNVLEWIKTKGWMCGNLLKKCCPNLDKSWWLGQREIYAYER